MRLTLSRLDLAFPELLGLPPEERIRRLRLARLQGRVPALVCPSAALFALAGYVQLITPRLLEHAQTHAATIDDARFAALCLAFALGAGFTSALPALLTRDGLLSRALRSPHRTPRCRRCAQSLSGLPVQDAPEGPWVRCPECGVAATLRECALTEDDLEPHASA